MRPGWTKAPGYRTWRHKTGALVEHCGHPTALYPYTGYLPDGTAPTMTTDRRMPGGRGRRMYEPGEPFIPRFGLLVECQRWIEEHLADQARRSFAEDLVASSRAATQLLLKLAAVLIVALALSAGAGEPRDGSWWRALSDRDKQMFTLGYFDGLSGGQRIAQAMHADQDYFNALARFKGLDNWQIAAGLDQFYAGDFRNLPIELNDAAMVVAMAAAGETPEHLRGLIAQLREQAAAERAGR